MKLFLICLTCLMMTGCLEEPSKEEGQMRSDLIVTRMYYFKDPRTGLCFSAYHFTGNDQCGLTCVPCESVPEDMLYEGKVLK